MNQNLPLTRDLVLIGGGHSHALVLRMWGMKPLPGVRLTLINPGPTAPYSGMLPGFVAGHYRRDELDIDLIKLARFAKARLITGAATSMDLASRTVQVSGYPDIAYDVASIDIGITSDLPGVDGYQAHAISAKPLGPFAARWGAVLASGQNPGIAVLGAGVAGAELSLAMAHALGQRGHRPVIQLIDQAEVLSLLNPTARRLLLGRLRQAGVALHEGRTVSSVSSTGVTFDDGTTVPAEMIVGAAGATPHGWLASCGLAHRNGFVTVEATLQSSDPVVFAAGDCAEMSHAPRPKAGVFAVRQAPVLFDNLRAALSGGDMRPYRPQRDYLKLISLGGKSALAEKFGTAAEGRLLWRWKDWIDRRFMDKFTDLPAMETPGLPLTVATGVREALGSKPMCGGCGAKVGRGALRDALAKMPSGGRGDIESLPGDDAAVLVTGGVRQVISTDHLRAMVADPIVMTRIAAVHALGDIWAMGAAPQAATASLILPRQSAELQQRSMVEIMRVATEVFEAAGAAVVGGHSSMGDELTVGFTVTGLCARAPITLKGARAGDAIVLTKPIGSGVVMAAEMSGQAAGADVVATLAIMQQGQAAASTILGDAHAMTDVTGFGLAGHLAGICEASGVGAELQLAEVPLMPGALALAEAGVRSTIWADNREGAGAVFGAAGARGDLLFDPQTAGGMLAAVDPSQVDEVTGQLRDAGYPAVVIGRFVAGAAQITVNR